MAIEIKYTTYFEKQLKRLVVKYPSINTDLTKLCAELELNPDQEYH